MCKLVFTGILVISIFGCSAFKITDELIAVGAECARENNINDISFFREGRRPDEPILSSHDYKCFLKCIATKSGLTSVEGELDVEKLKQKFHPSEASLKVIIKCITNNNQGDICERVAAEHVCIMEELKH